MSDSMALGFIKEYNDLGFEGKSKERQLKLQSLKFQYGDLSNNALQQLIKAGLPTGAESALVLGDAKTFDIFMSFDDPEKIKAITNYLTDQDDPDISLKKIRAAIVSESDFKDIDNIISRNTPFNNSKTLVKMDQIKETLSLYAANLMRNNPGMSVNNAAKEASLLFSDNYQIEDTYYFPKNIPGINQKQRDFTISKLENIKFNYIKQHFKPVAYESSVEGKTDLELTERMNYNIIENGEWRNHPNGEGFVFGIVLSGNSFGILKNEAGEELFVSYDDDSLILPGGSNTIIDMNIPTEQQKKQFRGYYGYADKMKQENTTFGQRTNLDNNEMQNALEDSGASTVEIPNPLISEVKADMVTKQDKALANPDLKKRIKKFEGVNRKGLNTPYQLEYEKDGKIIKEDFYTVGHGHRLPKGAEIREYSDEEINNFFEEDMKIATERVNKLGELNKINLDTIKQDAYDILVEMALNMGSNPYAKPGEKKGLFGFTKTLKAIKNEEYELASEHMVYNFEGEDYLDTSKKIGNTDWYKQVKKDRAMTLKRLMSQIKK
jgi:hypothetical protein